MYFFLVVPLGDDMLIQMTFFGAPVEELSVNSQPRKKWISCLYRGIAFSLLPPQPASANGLCAC